MIRFDAMKIDNMRFVYTDKREREYFTEVFQETANHLLTFVFQIDIGKVSVSL